MEDNKPTMSDDKFTNLPTLDSLSSTDETSKYGSLSFGGFQNTGSTNTTGTKAGSVNRPMLQGPSTAGLYQSPVAFDPGARNIERYKDHPAYTRLGFSVLRDNELHYNASTSWVGDWRRAMKLHNFGAGFAQGFTGNYQGLSTIFGGDMFNPEAISLQKGRMAEEAAARSMSTRGGIGQSLVNIPYNLNYTLGIVASIAAEDLALAAAAPGTFGGSLTYGAYRTVKGAGKAIKSLWSTAKNADRLKDLVSMKDIYDTTRGIAGGALKGVAEAFVPNTGRLASQAYSGSSKLTSAGKAGDALTELFTTAQGFGAAYRDFRMISLAVDESAVEAAGVRNSIEDNLIREYVNANGELPTGLDLDRIIKTSQEASSKDYFGNLPVIYATNAVTFNSLTLPYSLTGGTLRVAKNKAGSLFVKTVGTKVEKEILTKSQLLGKAFTDKDYAKYALGSALNYMKGNLAEGFQEIYQEGLSASLEDYYTNHYFTYDVTAAKAMSKSVKKGLSDQMSQQGLEAFLGGFLGGAGVNAVTGSLQQGRVAAAQLGGKFNSDFKTQYETRRQQDKEALDAMANIVEEHGANVLGAFAPEFKNFKVQSDGNMALVDAAELDDRKAFEDIKDSSLFNHITRLAGTGTLDKFIEALENHKLLSEEDMKTALNVESKEQGDKLIDDLVKRSKSISAITIKLDSRYRNPFADRAFDMKASTEQRKEALISFTAFEEAKKDFIYSFYKSGRTLDRLDEIYNAAVTDPAIASMLNKDFNVLFSSASGRGQAEGGRLYEESLQAEIGALGQEILAANTMLVNLENSDADPATKAEQKRIAEKQLSDATKKKELLTNYSIALNAILSKPSIEEALKDTKTLEGFEKAINEYLKYMGNRSNSLVDAEQIMKLKNQILDFFRLTQDQVRFNNAAAALSDPEQFSRWYEVHKSQLSKAYIKYLASALSLAQDMVNNEHRIKLINELEAIKVVIDAEQNEDGSPSQLEKFLNEGEVPTKFFSINESDTNIAGYVIEGSETWNKIQEIIERYSLLDEEFAGDLENAKKKAKEQADEAKETTPETPESVQATPPQEEIEEEVPVEEVKENQEASVNYQETAIANKYAELVNLEGINPIMQELNDAWAEYRRLNPKERIATLTQFMNGPGRTATEEILKQADAQLAEAPVAEPVVESTVEEEFEIARSKGFEKMKSRINRTSKVESLEARISDIRTSEFTALEKSELIKLAQNKIEAANMKEAEELGIEAGESPVITEELQEDLNNSSEILDDAAIGERFESDIEEDPFDNEEVC